MTLDVERMPHVECGGMFAILVPSANAKQCELLVSE